MRMDETREYKGVYQTIVKFGCGSLGTYLKSTHPTYKYFQSPHYFARPVWIMTWLAVAIFRGMPVIPSQIGKPAAVDAALSANGSP
jgi:hypothetical protein